MLRTALILGASLVFALPAQSATILFDFDTGAPALTVGMPLPINQTAGGVKAAFSGSMSVQNSAAPYVPTNMNNEFLWPSVSGATLMISFDHLLTSLSFDFATPDFGSDFASTVVLAAFHGTVASPVGSSTNAGTLDASGSWGIGNLSFASVTPFDLVTIGISASSRGPASNFLVDNVLVTPVPSTGPPVPEPQTAAMVFVAALFLVASRRRPRS